jgi:hypothetical protein
MSASVASTRTRNRLLSDDGRWNRLGGSFSKLSADELGRMQGTIYNANQTEWNAFHAEWWKRFNDMYWYSFFLQVHGLMCLIERFRFSLKKERAKNLLEHLP